VKIKNTWEKAKLTHGLNFLQDGMERRSPDPVIKTRADLFFFFLIVVQINLPEMNAF
jgi:hypothetical protein